MPRLRPMRVLGALMAISWIAISTPPAFAGHTLTPGQEAIVASWLAQHDIYRLATDKDCDCDTEIQKIRAGYGGGAPIPDYHPYTATGDFNGDGVDDFAIVAINTSNQNNNYELVVFNGPFVNGAVGKATAAPAFTFASLELRNQGLFYGPPLAKPYRLTISRFGKQDSVLMPDGNSYKWVDL